MANCCTMWFAGTWNECCCRHDRRYENKRITRRQADELLFRCVLRHSNYIIATIMWLGVRAFGWYFYKK